MGRLIEELDYRPTAMGPLVLRRRWVAAVDQDVVEVILGDEHLMSSLFTVGEIELAVRGLAAAKGDGLRVLVGGLGLGYTARAALAHPRVASVEVVDALGPVIEWHRAGLVPIGDSLGTEPRCTLSLGDFFGWFDEARAARGEGLRVLVGGLGLGYTARAALAHPRVTSVEVVDALEPVIEWHRAGLVPIGDSLGQEPRCTLSLGDFFGWFGEARAAGERYDVVLLDIDHSPRKLLHPDHARFYSPEGLARVRESLAGDGVFAMWSDEGPDDAFLAVLASVFPAARAEVVAFDNPLTGGASTCTIYVAGPEATCGR